MSCPHHKNCFKWGPYEPAFVLPLNDWYNIENALVTKDCNEECISLFIAVLNATKRWADFEIQMLLNFKLGIQDYYPNDMKIGNYSDGSMSEDEKKEFCKFFKDMDVVDQFKEENPKVVARSPRR
ncbi:hypothetical protein DFA_09718 [Cavenderia fasciculata]|uniref:Uncharacterized protein n=1 Tax=Cavenderia fasciculata TaxID=261658 RepID=F4Q8E6_CACFS|nr:uncharacterized protein DFA_09718 [Cavenderia fasciculata]EGG16046.1 hypothetical protein DFA_09718 [Cavenderia fasciculata]|eukprot:XP_004352371.1 hypothetical protein DFA_09718 [Cavenderia fasciculata]